MKQKSIENIIITINAARKIITIFLGPFLTAYFIKISVESIVDLSIYYIFSYIILGVGSIIIAAIIKSKFQVGMFRIGVITNFIYILVILILRENIVNHLGIIAILYGISSASYWFPYNIFTINKVKNSDRTSFSVKSELVSQIIGISCPIVLGGFITVTNFELTAIIIAIISLIQIICSFMIPLDRQYNMPSFNFLNVWKKLWKDSQIRKMCAAEFFIGMNLSDGALQTVMTILIFNSFKTDMNMGIITSISSILTMISIKIYGKVYKNRNDKRLILLSSIIPTITLIILLLSSNNFTIILYNFCFVIFTTILSLTRVIRLYNLSDSYIVNREVQVEFFSGREFILNLGRIVSYIMLLIAGIIGSQIAFNVVMILLTLSILATGLFVRKVDKFEN